MHLKYELVLYDRLHKLRQQYRDYLMAVAIQGVDDESVLIDEKFLQEKKKNLFSISLSLVNSYSRGT